ncbi:MAG: hypothetical protein WC473_03060 [Patescibacteria group bacterium]|jgi:hypothetical protein
MVVYWLLIPLTILDGMAMSYFSWQSSLTQNWWSFICLILINIAPLWPFISKYSKNLIFDGLLFVVSLTAAELITVSFLDRTQSPLLINWLGLFIAFIGFVLIKLPWPLKKSTTL